MKIPGEVPPVPVASGEVRKSAPPVLKTQCAGGEGSDVQPANSSVVSIDAPPRTNKAAVPAMAPMVQVVQMEEDIARLQDELLEVLEENQILRMELESVRSGFAALQNKAS